MSYRFIRVTSIYPAYIQAFYEKKNNLNEMTYDEQLKTLAANSLELCFSFGKYLRKQGVDATEIISNDETLLNKWAKENSLKENSSIDDIILAQLKKSKPNVIWVDTTSYLNKKWVNMIKSELPSLKLIVAHICAPYNSVMAESFGSFDIVFTCSPCTFNELKGLDVNTYLLYHSFDHSVLEILKNELNDFEENDFTFTGSLLTGYGLHKTRIKYLEKLINIGVDIKIYGNIESQKTIRLKQGLHHTIKILKSFGLDKLVENNSILKKYSKYGDDEIVNYSKQLIDSVSPPVFGIEMYKALQKAKLCFNIHGDIAKKCGGNLRLFEATGVGTCLVTDFKDNLKDIFDIDKEIVTYNSVEECVEKVTWLLENPLEIKEIAIAGQERVLRDHTVERRAAEINELFKNKM
jgi:spore maturation protein CgeB